MSKQSGAPSCRRAVGLNHRLRLYRYAEDEIFGPHHDGAWKGAGLDADGRHVRDLWRGQRLSMLTLLLYLKPLDAYGGGETTFFPEPDSPEVTRV